MYGTVVVYAVVAAAKVGAISQAFPATTVCTPDPLSTARALRSADADFVRRKTLITLRIRAPVAESGAPPTTVLTSYPSTALSGW